MMMIKRVLILLATALCVPVLLTSPAGAASATPASVSGPQRMCTPDIPCPDPPPCSGTGCSGLNPQSTGCSDNASNVSSAYVALLGAYMDIRHSSWCNSNWVRLRFVDGSCAYSGIEIQRRALSGGSWQITGSQQATRGVTCASGDYWTKMVGGTPGEVRARYADGSAAGFTWHAWGPWH